MLKTQSIVFALIALLAAWPAQADIYKYVDQNGHVYYTDKPRHSGYYLLYRTQRAVRKAKDWQRFSPLIQAAAAKHSIDPKLLHAVIRAESAYDPDAVSEKGAVGLMQLMPATAKRYGVHDSRDPLENIEGGAHYLRDLMEMFDADIRLAVAAYNAGEQAVKKFGNQIPPFPETQEYVGRVMGFYAR